MKLLILGDIHGKWNRVNKIVDHELTEGDSVLSTGDLGNYNYAPKRKIPLYFIWGNHENYWAISDILDKECLLRPIESGKTYSIGGIIVSGLSGVYSPYFFENEQHRTRRIKKYFSTEDIERVLNIEEKVDIFITHEAPLRCGFIKEKDRGINYINEILKVLQPKFLFVGHHHEYRQSQNGKTMVVGMDMPNRHYQILDPRTLEIRNIKADLESTREGYKYDWEKN